MVLAAGPQPEGAASVEVGKPSYRSKDPEPAIAVLPPTTEKRRWSSPRTVPVAAPEWQCDHWARIVRDAAIVLCPRGRRISSKYEGSNY